MPDQENDPMALGKIVAKCASQIPTSVRSALGLELFTFSTKTYMGNRCHGRIQLLFPLFDDSTTIVSDEDMRNLPSQKGIELKLIPAIVVRCILDRIRCPQVNWMYEYLNADFIMRQRVGITGP